MSLEFPADLQLLLQHGDLSVSVVLQIIIGLQSKLLHLPPCYYSLVMITVELVLQLWAGSPTLHCSSSLTLIEYLAADSGGCVCKTTSCSECGMAGHFPEKSICSLIEQVYQDTRLYSNIPLFYLCRSAYSPMLLAPLPTLWQLSNGLRVPIEVCSLKEPCCQQASLLNVPTTHPVIAFT